MKRQSNAIIKVYTGKELKFISQINRDGLSVTLSEDKDFSLYDDEEFMLITLSISNRTYIACGFNSYVVKIK